MQLAPWLSAGLWGLLAGGALVLGACAGYYLRVPARLIAMIMGFGSGVLISAMSFELMEVAYRKGGFNAAALGLVAGAVAYTIANRIVSRYGAKHRKRSSGKQPSEKESGGSGTAIAIGALLDGVPEAIVIGLSMLEGGKVSRVAVAAIFLSNIPEGLSSAAGMKRAGRSALYVFGVWGGIALVSGAGALIGFSVFEHLPLEA
ncbi:MAG TPA: ZIP family zinc transporter, partial [Burkholderiaceae bacterium]